jgi:hypothetical protein
MSEVFAGTPDMNMKHETSSSMDSPQAIPAYQIITQHSLSDCAATQPEQALICG